MQSNKTEQFANEAIFTLQLNTAQAVRYVQHNAGVGYNDAKKAIKSTVVFHKQPKQECVAS